MGDMGVKPLSVSSQLDLTVKGEGSIEMGGSMHTAGDSSCILTGVGCEMKTTNTSLTARSAKFLETESSEGVDVVNNEGFGIVSNFDKFGSNPSEIVAQTDTTSSPETRSSTQATSIQDLNRNAGGSVLKMPSTGFGASVRNFFANFCMKVAAFFHGETRFESNKSTSNAAKNALSAVGFQANTVNVIDTPRDGNCMLWSALISRFGARKIEENFNVMRNEVIPYLREQIASEGNAGSTRAAAIQKNVGLGAENIKPNEMGSVAKALRCDIAIITQQGEQAICYLCQSDGQCLTNQSLNFPQDRFISALNEGLAIYATGNHARALQCSGAAVLSNSNETNMSNILNISFDLPED